MRVRAIKVGDRIRFRSATRHSDEQVWRTVTGVTCPTCGNEKRVIQVRFHGWGNFHVRPNEISDHRPKTD